MIVIVFFELKKRMKKMSKLVVQLINHNSHKTVIRTL